MPRLSKDLIDRATDAFFNAVVAHQAASAAYFSARRSWKLTMKEAGYSADQIAEFEGDLKARADAKQHGGIPLTLFPDTGGRSVPV